MYIFVKKLLLFVASLVCIGNAIIAQEVLYDLQTNPVLTNHQPALIQKQGFIDDTLSLPFWDDFSYTSVYPDGKVWDNSIQSVFINNTYAIGPATYGVATFDAVNKDGLNHENASHVPFVADTLLSKHINLSEADTSSTWLSFYYQPQGYGNAPEANDSLILEFSGNGTDFEQVWHATGTDFKYFKDSILKIVSERDTLEFKLVMIKVDSAKYFSKGFRFQFKNYASFAGDYNPSAAVNCDHWNIDYVYLNDNRSETDIVFKDVAYVELPNSILRNLESVPWSHYDDVQALDLSKVNFRIRNNYNLPLRLETIDIRLKDIEANVVVDSINTGDLTIKPSYNLITHSWQYDKDPFYKLEQDELHVEYEMRFQAEDDYPRNNIVTKNYHYSNYYAFDDGSAENAYGIESQDARVAYKFKSYKADSLKAVNMYFLQTAPEGEGAQIFNLCVWGDNNGVPGDLLLEDAGKDVVFSDKTNTFVSFELSKAIFVEGEFYIGWIQKVPERLNVGFDRNINSSSKLFYNIYGSWENSQVVGSLMMRPVLGYLSSTAIKSKTKEPSVLEIYPNPANNYIRFSNTDIAEKATILIYNCIGAIKYKGEYKNEIDVSNLPNGMYVVTLTSENNEPKVTRLVISR